MPYTLALYHARCMSSSSENRESLSKQVSCVIVCLSVLLMYVCSSVHGKYMYRFKLIFVTGSKQPGDNCQIGAGQCLVM